MNKICKTCFIKKPEEDYKLWKSGGKVGRYKSCKACIYLADSQRVLSKELAAGSRSISNCDTCDLLYKIKIGSSSCVSCRRKLSLKAL